jgi:hypothetical protein
MGRIVPPGPGDSRAASGGEGLAGADAELAVGDVFDQVDLFGSAPAEHTVINRSCEEPGTPSITLSSPILAAGPSGGASITLSPSDEDGTFKGVITPAPGAAEGKYEAVVSCGSGRVGVGKIGFVP